MVTFSNEGIYFSSKILSFKITTLFTWAKILIVTSMDTFIFLNLKHILVYIGAYDKY